jgi:hypothetical protein
VGDRIKIGEAKGDVIDVRYLVHPKESGRVKTSLTKNLLLKLNAESERVLFPRSNLR